MFRREIFVFAGDDLTFLVTHEVEGLSDAEVGELHVVLVGEHDFFRAAVAVYDTDTEGAAGKVGLGVGVGEAAGEMAFGASRRGYGVNKFYHHKILSAKLPDVVGLDGVRGDEIGDKAGLADNVF